MTGHGDGDGDGREGDRSGTGGYPDRERLAESGTEGYRAPTRPRLTSEDIWNPPPDDGRPLHERLGFDDLGDFLCAIDEIDRPFVSRRRVRPPATTQRAAEYHQVGLKLSLPDHELLKKAARDLGLLPTTLARVIVVRALRDAREKLESESC